MIWLQLGAPTSTKRDKLVDQIRSANIYNKYNFPFPELPI